MFGDHITGLQQSHIERIPVVILVIIRRMGWYGYPGQTMDDRFKDLNPIPYLSHIFPATESGHV